MAIDEINKIIDIFIHNLPNNLKNVNKPIVIDLVLDGGLFNGSYLIGALFFLKEMEKRNYIKINRISGCSIGSLLGLLYFIDSLDLAFILYDTFSKNFKENYNFEIYKNLNTYLQGRIPHDVCNKINKKLFIKYNNIKKGNQKVKCIYKNVNDIIDTIIRSSFFPYIIDGEFAYKEKYFDGFNPYIFKKRSNVKIIFLDLCGVDKLSYMLNIKNEKNNFHRILTGLTDIYTFFIKQSETSMCSCVNDWSYLNKIRFYIRQLIEKLLFYIIFFIQFIKKYISSNKYTNNILCTIVSKITCDIFIIVINKYCI
jgi:hypothetical protein